ncbi:MAG TPA: extensin family protein [Polyangiaceae bacterium]|nr:extensin family protein [Polyangiaceae bacterium]
MNWLRWALLAAFSLAAAVPLRAEPAAKTRTPNLRVEWFLAEEDPDDDRIVGPPDVIADCSERLRRLGVEHRSAPIALRQKRSGTYMCGNEQTVLYRSGPERIRYNAAPLVGCGLALALAHFEHLVQEEAELLFMRRVRRIEQGGTYNCRRMTRFQHLVSEHSYANAIDVRAFVLEDGRRISVRQHFGRLDREPATPQAKFLRRLARRLYDERVFSVVLTPYWDALHRDHFHLDMARYRVDGTR